MAIYRIAVIGSGVAGLTASHLIKKQHRVTLFEADTKLGGQTRTVKCDDGRGGIVGVDTGFSVFNDRSYPTFNKLLAELDVRWRLAEVSISVTDSVSGLEYCSGSFDSIFAQRKNLRSRKFLGMLFDIARFWRSVERDLALGLADEETLDAWLKRHKFSGAIVNDYLVPTAATIWSSSAAGIFQFPAGTFLEVFRNHGFFKLARKPRWQSIVGGSEAYIEAWKAHFSGDIALESPIGGIARTPQGVILSNLAGQEYGEFDYVVIATHADQALRLLGDAGATPEEREILSAWSYRKNLAVLHEDSSVMPSNRSAWGSWNYHKDPSASDAAPVSVTYDMNRLQGLKCERRFFVTLNPMQTLKGEIARFSYSTPIMTKSALKARIRLTALQGQNRTFYCGSYHGYGFHEDGARSGAQVAALLDCSFSDKR